MALLSCSKTGDANGKPAAGGIGRSGFPVHALHRPVACPSSQARAARRVVKSRRGRSAAARAPSTGSRSARLAGGRTIASRPCGAACSCLNRAAKSAMSSVVMAFSPSVPSKDLRIGIGTRAGHDLKVLLEFSACDPAIGRDDDPARPRINQPVDRHDSRSSKAARYASAGIASAPLFHSQQRHQHAAATCCHVASKPSDSCTKPFQ
jgi:hypothetical protein